MEFRINNEFTAERISTCLNELSKIKEIIEQIGGADHSAPYLTRYSIIRACGVIEYGFKSIISDINSENQSQQVKQFIDNKFRRSSMNPSFENICKSLDSFDNSWSQRFKDEINKLKDKDRIKTSLKSLNEARNSFAHGGMPSTSFLSIEVYFKDSVTILECIEKAISVN